MQLYDRIKELEKELHDLRAMDKIQLEKNLAQKLADVNKELKNINHKRDILVKKTQALCKHVSHSIINSYTGKYDYCDTYKCNSCGHQWSISR